MSNDWQRNYVTLPTGERIRYSLFKRNGDYYVRFRTREGDRVKRSTGYGGKQKQAAAEEAHKIILGEYGAVSESLETVTWDAARARLKEAMGADGRSLDTIEGYLETLDRLIDVCPSYGPGSITESLAAEFKRKYATGKYTRKRNVLPGEKPPQYARKAISVRGRIRTLRAVFKRFHDLRLVEKNPFENVSAPKVDKHEVKYVSEDDVIKFFAWLDERYGSWPMPRLFFSVKAASGCRLNDVCHLRSELLHDGRLTFTPDMTKTGSGRDVPLSPELYAELKAYAGETYLWERYPPELIEANNTKGWPTHRQNREFSPRRLYLWVVQIMQTYEQETGNDLSSHDFRRAALTRAAEANYHLKQAAVAFDVTAETMLRHYTAVDKKRAAEEVLGGLASRLVPPKRAAAENGPKMVPKE